MIGTSEPHTTGCTQNTFDVNTGICYIKIINFALKQSRPQKNFRLAAGPLSGITLGGEQHPEARCEGAKM